MRFSFGEAITVRRFSSWRALPLMAACSLLSGCAGGIIPEGHGPATTPAPTHKPTPAKPRPPVSPSQPTPAAPAETALTAGIAAGPSVSQVVPQDAHTVAALGAFRLSCPALMWRTDQSGLTQGTDWAQARRRRELARRNRRRFLRALFRDRAGRHRRDLCYRLL